ncbi:hypothetical protein ON010_g12568 [Phytophthora cinnamomi]|nr:hypothetical protein ON010_g12568 [Phytophthora cinnamomi]
MRLGIEANDIDDVVAATVVAPLTPDGRRKYSLSGIFSQNASKNLAAVMRAFSLGSAISRVRTEGELLKSVMYGVVCSGRYKPIDDVIVLGKCCAIVSSVYSTVIRSRASKPLREKQKINGTQLAPTTTLINHVVVLVLEHKPVPHDLPHRGQQTGQRRSNAVVQAVKVRVDDREHALHAARAGLDEDAVVLALVVHLGRLARLRADVGHAARGGVARLDVHARRVQVLQQHREQQLELAAGAVGVVVQHLAQRADRVGRVPARTRLDELEEERHDHAQLLARQQHALLTAALLHQARVLGAQQPGAQRQDLRQRRQQRRDLLRTHNQLTVTTVQYTSSSLSLTPPSPPAPRA